MTGGKQFSKEYQPTEKWTEDKALELGTTLIEWLKSEEEHMFFEEFLYITNDYYGGLISYLSNKFTSFSKLIEKAKKIQEIKLYKYGVFDKTNAQMTKFVLINEHDKTSEKTDNKNETTIKVAAPDAIELAKSLLDGSK